MVDRKLRRGLFWSIRGLVAISLLATVFVSVGGSNAHAALITRQELSGNDRFETAAVVAQQVRPETGGTVIIATGRNYPDALAAGPVAAKLDAPILLTYGTYVPETTVNAVKRQRPARVIVVGGEPAVPESVVSKLKTLTPSAAFVRYAGPDRHATAAVLAKTFFPDASTAFVATGWNFPDALSAGAAGASTGAPVLLGNKSGLTSPTWDALSALPIGTYYLIGGSNVLGHDTPPTALANAAMKRLSGEDRFATNAAVLQQFFTGTGNEIVVASARNFPDALVAAPLERPLVLAMPSCTGGASATFALKYLGLNPVLNQPTTPKVTRVGSGLASDAGLRTCKPSTAHEWYQVRPARVAEDDVSAMFVADFLKRYNEIAVENGLHTLTPDQVHVGLDDFSALAQRHADAKGALPPHDGMILFNEVAFGNGRQLEHYWDLDGAYVAESWWDSAPHRDILYQPSNGGVRNADEVLIINFVWTSSGHGGWDGHFDARATWGWRSYFKVEGHTVASQDVDLSLRDYTPPSPKPGATYNPGSRYHGNFYTDPKLYRAYESGKPFGPWP